MATKAVSNKPSLSVSLKSVDLGSPVALIEFAKTLKTFIVSEGLFTKIQNKNYVNVEGWQFAGAATGVFPVVKKVTRIELETNEIRYRAEVELKRLVDDTVVGYGVAICSTNEKGRANVDEYVIASMAQTRATGKAYRNAFAWLMKMAGMEATPAEEMDYTNSTGVTTAIDIDDLQAKINKAKDLDTLMEIMSGLTVDEQKLIADSVNVRSKEILENEPTNGTKN